MPLPPVLHENTLPGRQDSSPHTGACGAPGQSPAPKSSPWVRGCEALRGLEDTRAMAAVLAEPPETASGISLSLPANYRDNHSHHVVRASTKHFTLVSSLAPCGNPMTGVSYPHYSPRTRRLREVKYHIQSHTAISGRAGSRTCYSQTLNPSS